jgi:hypothetical protein
MKKIELSAAAKLIRMLLPALEQAGVRAPVSITPLSEVTEPHQTKAGCPFCKCELIVSDSLADHVVEVVARLPRDLRLAGLLGRLVILEIDENYHFGLTPLGQLVDGPQPTQRSRGLPGRKGLNQPG